MEKCPIVPLTLCRGSVAVETMTELQMVRARKKSATEAAGEGVGWAELPLVLVSASSHRPASCTLPSRFLSGLTSFSCEDRVSVRLCRIVPVLLSAFPPCHLEV